MWNCRKQNTIVDEVSRFLNRERSRLELRSHRTDCPFTTKPIGSSLLSFEESIHMSSSNTDLDEIPLSPVPRGAEGSDPSAGHHPSRHVLKTTTTASNHDHHAGPSSTAAAAAASAAADPPPRQTSGRPARGQRLKAGLSKVGTTLQKLNLAKLIDDMEHDQELADRLEVVNRDIHEELGRKELVREAHARCHAEIENHLRDFLEAKPEATYEDWIGDLHPDNVSEGTLLADLKQVDMRFYVIDSDHRMLWNQTVGEDRQVPPRTLVDKGTGAGAVDGPVDLLD
jgi:hypothetical protein